MKTRAVGSSSSLFPFSTRLMNEKRKEESNSTGGIHLMATPQSNDFTQHDV